MPSGQVPDPAGRLVRERMELTGESRGTKHRPSAHARHLLARAGLEVSEAMACGLGGGIGFMYVVFEYKQVSHPLLTIVAQHHPEPWLEAVSRHLGVRMSSVTSSTPAAALGKLDATLQRSQAAQLTVGRGLLPWHEGVPEMEAAAPYEVLVVGRDGDDYLVDDGADTPDRLTASELSAAWAAHRKGRFAIVTFDPITEPVDLPAAVRAAIATTVAHLTGPVLGHAFDVNFGLSGMAKLVSELRDTKSKTGWLKRFGNPEAFRVGMTRLDECLTWQYTAEGATRPLYARFLAEADSTTDLDLERAAADAAVAGEEWRTVAETARAARASGADPSATFADLADRVEAALARERSLVSNLASALAH